MSYRLYAKAKSQLKEKAKLFKGHKYLFGSDYRKNVSKEREKAGNTLHVMGLKKRAKQSRRSFQKGPHPEGSRDEGNNTRTVRIKRTDTGDGSNRKTIYEGELFVTKKSDGRHYLSRSPFRKRFFQMCTLL